MNRKTWPRNAASGMVILAFAAFAFGGAAAAQETKRKGVAVRHPNLLLDRKEIEQIRRKVREHIEPVGARYRIVDDARPGFGGGTGFAAARRSGVQYSWAASS